MDNLIERLRVEEAGHQTVYGDDRRRKALFGEAAAALAAAQKDVERHPATTRENESSGKASADEVAPSYVDFQQEVQAARSVWMEGNPCEDGHDHVTPFDRFLYGSQP